MYDLRDYKTLSARQITAPNRITHLGLRVRQPPTLGNQRSRTKVLKLLRRVKKAHKTGRIHLGATPTM